MQDTTLRNFALILDQHGVPIPVSSDELLHASSLSTALEVVSQACGRRCFRFVLCKSSAAELENPLNVLGSTTITTTATTTATPLDETSDPLASTGGGSGGALEADSALPSETTSRSGSPVPRRPKPTGPPLKALASHSVRYTSWPPRMLSPETSSGASMGRECSHLCGDNAGNSADASAGAGSHHDTEALLLQCPKNENCTDHHDELFVLYAILLGTPAPSVSVSNTPSTAEDLALSPNAITDLAVPYPTTKQLMSFTRAIHKRDGLLLLSVIHHYAAREEELLDDALTAAHPLWQHPRWLALLKRETERIHMQWQAERVLKPETAAPLTDGASGAAATAATTATTLRQGQSTIVVPGKAVGERKRNIHAARKVALAALRRAYFVLIDQEDRGTGAQPTTQQATETGADCAVGNTQALLAALEAEFAHRPATTTDDAVAQPPLFCLAERRSFLHRTPQAEAAFLATTLTDLDARRCEDVGALQHRYQLCLQQLRARWARAESDGDATRGGESHTAASHARAVAWLDGSGVSGLSLSTAVAVGLLRGTADDLSLAVNVVEYVVYLVFERLWTTFIAEAQTPDLTAPISVSPRRRAYMAETLQRIREEGSSDLAPWRHAVEARVRSRQVPVDTVLFVMDTIRRDANAITALVDHPEPDVRRTLVVLCQSL